MPHLLFIISISVLRWNLFVVRTVNKWKLVEVEPTLQTGTVCLHLPVTENKDNPKNIIQMKYKVNGITINTDTFKRTLIMNYDTSLRYCPNYRKPIYLCKYVYLM